MNLFKYTGTQPNITPPSIAGSNYLYILTYSFTGTIDYDFVSFKEIYY